MSKNKLKYIYFVSYFYHDRYGPTGYGQVGLERATKLNTQEEVASVNDFLKKKYDFEKVVILNFIRLKK